MQLEARRPGRVYFYVRGWYPLRRISAHAARKRSPGSISALTIILRKLTVTPERIHTRAFGALWGESSQRGKKYTPGKEIQARHEASRSRIPSSRDEESEDSRYRGNSRIDRASAGRENFLIGGRRIRSGVAVSCDPAIGLCSRALKGSKKER